MLQAVAEALDSRDIAGATRALLKLSKAQSVRHQWRSDAQFRAFLGRLCEQLHSEDLTIWAKDLADIAFALGKLQVNDNIVVELLWRIADIAKYRAEHFTPQDMASMVWGFASLGVRNEALMSIIAAEIVNKISGFDQRQLSNTAWAFAKCGLWNEQLVSAIAGECLVKISTFSAQSLSHISWAMAQWGTRKDDLMNAIAQEVTLKVADFMPAPLAMTAWSYASLQLKSTSMMSGISNESIQKIAQFMTQDLAHLAWAFANLRIQDQQLFNKMADEVQRNITGTHPPELANIAWAFSKNNFSHEELMTAIANEAMQQIHNFTSAEVAMLTWAFAVAGLQNKQLMTEIGAQVAVRIDRFSAQQLSHIAWAFGALSLRHSEFLQSLSMHVRGSMSSYKAQGLSNITWAFAMVTFRDESLIRTVSPEIARDAGELRPLALARCAWAYSVLAVQSPLLMRSVSAEALKKVEDFPTKALVKLIDSVYVSPAAAEHVQLQRVLAGRTAELAKFFRTTWGSPEAMHTVNAEEYCRQLHNFGLIDCGIIGTPLLLFQLKIELPSGAFVQRCRSQVWLSACPEGSRGPGQGPRDRDEYTAAEFSLTIGEQTHHGWSARCANDQPAGQDSSADAAAARPEAGSQGKPEHWLVACELPGRRGSSETTCAVLEDLCSKIYGFGVDLRSPEACSGVQGSVQIMSTTVPCVSSVGAMWQFTVLFPNVVLEFAEQVGGISD